jgi:hypothetical protein
VRAWPRCASRACLIGNTVRQRILWNKKTRDGYGTRPYDWELDELESMKTLSLGKLPVIQPIAADHHECQAH